jgi:hypothetical protein
MPELDVEQLANLVYEALETELGGVQVYETALTCALHDELKEEWQRYLAQTRRHVEVVGDLCLALSLDPAKETPARRVVRQRAEALVSSMKVASAAGDPVAAQIVAAECVVDAEAKDHRNWELIGEAAEHAAAAIRRALLQAHEAVEDEENEHLYHSMGWARELRIDALGLPAVLPPPEEEKHVKTAIGADRAKRARTDLL